MPISMFQNNWFFGVIEPSEKMVTLLFCENRNYLLSLSFVSTYYLFSGLGADHRAFDALEFPGKTKHVDWIPALPNEPIAGYAKRLATQISEPYPVLVGLSFGGMMATEVARHVTTERLILISSAKSRAEIPPYYQWVGRLRLQRFMPDSQIRKANRMLFWLFGAKTLQERDLLNAILHDTDPAFFRWATTSIGTWRGQAPPHNTVHIHGTADRILPFRYVNADYAIHGGTHFMAVNRAKEINKLIKHIAKADGSTQHE